MPLYRVKLVDGAFDKAQGQDVNVGFLESEERFEQEQADDGTFQVRKREYSRLRQYGLIDDAEVDPAAQARNDEDEPDVDHRDRRVARTRDEGQVSAVPVGGAGHFPGDNYSNQRIHDEAMRDQEQGLALQKERGLPNVRETQSEEALRSDHSLPEQEKAFREAEEKRDKDLEKAQEKAKKDREKAQREHEKANEKAEREQQRRAEDERKGNVDSEGVAQAREAEKAQDQAASDQEQDRRDRTEDRRQSGVGAVRADDEGSKSSPRKGK